MSRLASLIVLVLFTLLPAFATAGSSAAGNPQLPQAQVTAFADRLQQDLAARGASVAIVARTGRDPAVLPDGVRYTHVAFWVYSRITNANGTTGNGYRVYNLYQTAEGSSRSHLVQDSPADFMAGAWRFDAGVIIPAPQLQRKILQVIAGPTYGALHNPRYSVMSNPANDMFQNCTEHTLDVLMAALYGTSERAQIKANIGAYFQPQPIRLDGVQRTLAGVASQALTTRDHGSSVGTATFSSIARFMQANGLAGRVYRLTPTGPAGL